MEFQLESTEVIGWDFQKKRNEALDKIHPKIGMKKLVYGLPEFLQPKAEPFGMVMNISEGWWDFRNTL